METKVGETRIEEAERRRRKNKEGQCCGNHLSQELMIIQVVNLLSWISNGKFTKELDKESLLN